MHSADVLKLNAEVTVRYRKILPVHGRSILTIDKQNGELETLRFFVFCGGNFSRKVSPVPLSKLFGLFEPPNANESLNTLHLHSAILVYG